MLKVIGKKIRRNALTSALTIGLSSLPGGASAETAMTAGVVMDKMPERERFAYVAGIVEGLAYARFANDGKRTEAMGCIYDWFYKKDHRINDIYQAFGRFRDHLPGAIVAAMVARECGK